MPTLPSSSSTPSHRQERPGSRPSTSARSAAAPAVIGPLYAALDARIFDERPARRDDTHGAYRGTAAFLAPVLAEVGLPADLLDALDDDRWDVELQRESDEALALTGRDVGTPIIQHRPPDGVAFFGPVISRLPTPEQAVPPWQNVLGLASFSGFAEFKRSLRERPQLASFGVAPETVGVEEEWHAGSRPSMT